MRAVVAAALLACAVPFASCSSPNPVRPHEVPAARVLYPDHGGAVVAWVAARYPEHLAAGVTLEQRQRSVEFLRDKIIEVGLCGGMDLGWNQKRGVGPRSIDAIGWRHGPAMTHDVVDIAFAWEYTHEPLRLQWLIVPGPAGWEPHPQPKC
jgi:hypothetical protein